MNSGEPDAIGPDPSASHPATSEQTIPPEGDLGQVHGETLGPGDEPGPATDSSPATSSAAGRARVGDIQSFEDFFRFAYEQTGKRFTVPSATFELLSRRLDDAPVQPDPVMQTVVALSDEDPLMTVPPRMLVVIDEASPGRRLVARLTDYITPVMRHHRVFRRSELRSLFDGAGIDIGECATIVRQTIHDLRPEELEKLSGSTRDVARRKLESNAIITLLLWWALRNSVRAAVFLDLLHIHVWAPERSRAPVGAPRASLADSRTPELLGWVADEFTRRLRAAEGSVEQAEASADRARQRIADVEAELTERGRQVEQHLAEISALRSQLQALEATVEQERRSRVVDQTHHLDNYKTLRTRVLRTLDRQTDLLDTALHAIRNGRTSVTEEYVDRVLGALQDERDRLRDQED